LRKTSMALAAMAPTAISVRHERLAVFNIASHFFQIDLCVS
jgi:hypothetical protein